MAGVVLAGSIGAAPSGAPLGEPARTAATDVPHRVLPAQAGAATPLGHGLVVPPAPPPVELAPAAFTTAAPDERAAIAVATAMAQIGLPYVWGGNGPEAGDAGFDCSGLTTFAYRAAGIVLPRTAHTQYFAGPHVPAGAALQPGDLVFYGTAARVHHVGMYIGAGRMVNAPRRGKPVQVAYYRWRGDDYLGASRPAATGVRDPGLLPPAPAPAPPSPGDPQVFAAPPAPLPAYPLPRPGDPAPPEHESAAGAIDEAGRTGAQPYADVQEGPAAAEGGRATAPGAGAGQLTPGTPPPTSVPSTSVPSTSVPSTSVPSTSVPSTSVPSTSVPSTSVPPTTTPPTTAPPGTGRAAEGGAAAPSAADEEPVRAVEATLPGGTVTLRSVARGDPLPAVPSTGGGHWSGTGRTVLVVAAPDLFAGGGAVTVAFSDGSTAGYTAREVVTASAAEAAAILDGAPRGGMVALAPAGEDRWSVLTAR